MAASRSGGQRAPSSCLLTMGAMSKFVTPENTGFDTIQLCIICGTIVLIVYMTTQARRRTVLGVVFMDQKTDQGQRAPFNGASADNLLKQTGVTVVHTDPVRGLHEADKVFGQGLIPGNVYLASVSTDLIKRRRAQCEMLFAQANDNLISEYLCTDILGAPDAPETRKCIRDIKAIAIVPLEQRSWFRTYMTVLIVCLADYSGCAAHIASVKHLLRLLGMN